MDMKRKRNATQEEMERMMIKEGMGKEEKKRECLRGAGLATSGAL